MPKFPQNCLDDNDYMACLEASLLHGYNLMWLL